MTDTAPEPLYADIPGGRIAYHDVGSGDPVILIHGGGPGASGYSNFSRNIAPLSAGRRVIAIDLPGYGGSANREVDGSLFDPLSAALLGLMDSLDIACADLIGNSLGAGTALRTAIDHPDRVGRLVMMGAGGSMPVHSVYPTPGLMKMFGYYLGDGPSEARLRAILNELVYDPKLITPELFEARLKASMRPDVIANPPLKQRSGAGAMRDELWREPLFKVKHPVLLIWGREDKVIPLDAAFLYARTLPNAELHVFPRCGHWAQWEKADAFNALVISFLDRPSA
jgi:4,5:9,10-diseco-3-hydroxy-5,9,17-trioxoandrosta-1(10),2-diene-4-oate hydrolase